MERRCDKCEWWVLEDKMQPAEVTLEQQIIGSFGDNPDTRELIAGRENKMTHNMDYVGECRRFPPTEQINDEPCHWSHDFKMVPGHYWCGEFKAKFNPDILLKNIDTLPVCVRTMNKLKKMEINTLGDLCQRGKNAIIAYKVFSEMSLLEIELALKYFELEWQE